MCEKAGCGIKEEVRQREQVQQHNPNAQQMKPHVREMRRPCTRTHQCTPKHNPALPLQSHPPLPLKTTPHTQHRNTSTRNPSPQSSSKQAHLVHCSTSA